MFPPIIDVFPLVQETVAACLCFSSPDMAECRRSLIDNDATFSSALQEGDGVSMAGFLPGQVLVMNLTCSPRVVTRGGG